MNGSTYETKDRKEKIETYEWDDVWIDFATAPEEKRVFYIGDSISRGIRRIATEKTGGKIHFDSFATSKAVDNPFFVPSVSLFAKQETRRDAVIFNNGLHGWHLDDETEYKKFYEEMVSFLIKEFAGTPVYIVLTTHVSDADRGKRVIARNNAALEIAKKYNLEVIDLYSASLENAHLLSSDGVHFSREGYEKLAEKILDTVCNVR